MVVDWIRGFLPITFLGVLSVTFRSKRQIKGLGRVSTLTPDSIFSFIFLFVFFNGVFLHMILFEKDFHCETNKNDNINSKKLESLSGVKGMI